MFSSTHYIYLLQQQAFSFLQLRSNPRAWCWHLHAWSLERFYLHVGLYLVCTKYAVALDQIPHKIFFQKLSGFLTWPCCEVVFFWPHLDIEARSQKSWLYCWCLHRFSCFSQWALYPLQCCSWNVGHFSYNCPSLVWSQ